MKVAKKILVTASIGCLVIGGYQVINFGIRYQNARKEDKKAYAIIHEQKPETSEKPKGEQSTKEPFGLSRAEFDSLKSNYPATIGYIAWDDEFISQPIAWTTDNDTYLYAGLGGNFDEQGTVFMDSRDTTDSQNITLYGHYVYYDTSARFSPLSRLTDQSTYDSHHRFRIWFEDRVNTYEIAYVAHLNKDTESDFDYALSDYYSDDVFNSHRKWLDNHQLIYPVEQARLESSEDKTVTLQTCVPWHTNLIELVIAKQVDTEKF